MDCLYGEDLCGMFHLFKCLKIERASMLCNLTFLLRCWDQKVIPDFAMVKHAVDSPMIRRVLYHTGLAIVWERIKLPHLQLDIVGKKSLRLHLELGAIMSKMDWGKCE